MKFLFFRWWVIRQCLLLEGMPYRMKFQTACIVSSCITLINRTGQPLFEELRKQVFKNSIKRVQNARSRLHRDKHRSSLFQPNPLFSQNQVVEIVVKFTLYWLLLLFFVSAEAFLFNIVAAFFVPGSSKAVKLFVALFLSVVLTASLSAGYKMMHEDKQASVRGDVTDIGITQFGHYKTRQFWAYVVIVLCYVVCVLSGMIRIYFLEHVPTHGLSPEKLTSIKRASIVSGFFTLLITVASMHYAALLKLELSGVTKKFLVFLYWKRAHKRENRTYRRMLRTATKLLAVVDKKVEEAWELTMQLKYIYKPVEEHDGQHIELYEEYDKERAKPDFFITPYVYAKYAALSCNFKELVRFGIISNPAVAEKIALAKEVLAMPQQHITEQLADVSAIRVPQHTSNGNGASKHIQLKFF